MLSGSCPDEGPVTGTVRCDREKKGTPDEDEAIAGQIFSSSVEKHRFSVAKVREAARTRYLDLFEEAPTCAFVGT